MAIQALILDLDGVLTSTARLHAEAWKQTFDSLLQAHPQNAGKPERPFDIEGDYRKYVDGMTREEGIRCFLKSRGISIPERAAAGEPVSVEALARQKNEMFHRLLDDRGVEPFPEVRDQVDFWKRAGLKTAVVSSSRNCKQVLRAAKLTQDFDTVVDGEDLRQGNLKGKPAPDLFLEAARRLAISPGQAAVVEDAIAGVQAGRRGGFARVIGIDRRGEGKTLREAGADLVISDLSQIPASLLCPGPPPRALADFDRVTERLRSLRPVLFLDYDGTLTPIVPHPDQAILPGEMRRAVENLAGEIPVAVISGRDLPDVREKVGLGGLCYAGSHGFDILTSEGRSLQAEQALEFLPQLKKAEEILSEILPKIEGAWVERKRFTLAVHYRQVAAEKEKEVEAAVLLAVQANERLRRRGGKKVWEIQPNLRWDKGRAVFWLLQAMGWDEAGHLPIYLGDDVTDEDAFRALKGRGLGLIVGELAADSCADFSLADPEEVRVFLEKLHRFLRDRRTT